MASDKIIQFPRAAGKSAAGTTPAKITDKKTEKRGDPAIGKTIPGADGLTEDQRKAMQVVLSGMGFVLIGIKPTPAGADFFTAIHGEAADLRNAQPHLDGVIERAPARKGV